MKKIILVAILLAAIAFSFVVHASSLKPPAGIDENAIAGLGKFVSAKYKHRALTEDEIKKQIGPVFEKNADMLYRLPELLESTKDEAALRLLLNVIYYQEKYAPVLNAELAESLDESFEIFFENSTNVIENVLKDKNQKTRESIAYNFDRYVQMLGLEVNGRPLPPHLDKLRKTINKYVARGRIKKGQAGHGRAG